MPKSPLTDSFIFILFIYFVFVGICFAVGTIKSCKDVAKYMESGLVGVAGFLNCMSACFNVYACWENNIATIIVIKCYFPGIALPGSAINVICYFFFVNIIITVEPK